MHIHNSRLTAALDRTRAAILGLQVLTNDLNATATWPTEPPAALVRLSVPAPAQVARPLPTCAPLSSITDGRMRLKDGPARLLELLHQVAVSTVAARAYPVAPSQVTIHQPQELLAAALGCHVVTVWRWTQDLITAGLLDARAHYTTSHGTTRTDGTLYTVALKPRHVAHLPHDDLKHEWRDLDGDRAAGRTAWNELQGSDPDRGSEGWMAVLMAWAVTPGSTKLPIFSDPCKSEPGTLQDVVYLLPLIASAHPNKRPALVGMMASTMSHALRDPHSRRYWCKAIWNAWQAELEGRDGLQVLAAQVARLSADLTEWPDLRKPGALLASRLKASL